MLECRCRVATYKVAWPRRRLLQLSGKAGSGGAPLGAADQEIVTCGVFRGDAENGMRRDWGSMGSCGGGKYAVGAAA